MTAEQERERKKRIIIEDYLVEQGIRADLNGFPYLVEAIMIYNPTMRVQKEIMEEVAKGFNATPSSVYRSCMHALSRSNSGLVLKQFLALGKLKIERRMEE